MGWGVVVLGTLLSVYAMFTARGVMAIPEWMPALAFAGVGVAVVLFGHVCEAVFDIADGTLTPLL